MKDRILKILNDLMAMESFSYSLGEQEPAEYFEKFFKSLPYFKKFPERTGVFQIPGDPFGRTIPYALLLGDSKETVVFSGHFDVVSTEEYGAAGKWACSGGLELEKKLRQMDLDDCAREDLKSGEWLWGRGSCDMKGGLAIHAALFEKYAQAALNGKLQGSIVFMLVPDEESYSAGMRQGTKLLSQLKEVYGLNYKLLIDPEPTALEEGRQTMSIGSVGKCMPAVMVQGKKSHAGHFFEGFSALSLISSIYAAINGSVGFCDIFQGEMTMPPTWFNMRDMKKIYDVSIPYRASGYFTVFSLEKTPEDILQKVKNIAKEAFESELAKLNETYEKFKEASAVKGNETIYYEPLVLTFAELIEKAKGNENFEAFYNELYEEILKGINEGLYNYPEATLLMMEKILDFSNIQKPLVAVGFAPPYYPPVHSDKIPAKENYGSTAYEFVSRISAEEFGQDVKKENFFMGISDLSYSAVTSPFDYGLYGSNTPLWGKGYEIDFESIENIGIPSVIYGPIGREYHQYTERVNKKSLLEVVPNVTEKLVEYMWNL